ncbi:restriction endonuclease subunit S, partial [Metamycoplasma equirhinis]
LYSVISGGINPMGYIDKYNRNENIVTISQYGTAGYINYQTEKFWSNDVVYSLYTKENVINKYLFYVLKNMQEHIYDLVIKEAVPHYLPLEFLNPIVIPIPSLEVQQKIVNILDKLETYSKDIKTGLP